MESTRTMTNEAWDFFKNVFSWIPLGDLIPLARK